MVTLEKMWQVQRTLYSVLSTTHKSRRAFAASLLLHRPVPAL